MADIIAFANHKGGVGKTTTVMNTAGVLGERGYKVLIVDLDPQASLSLGFGANISELKFTISEAMIDRRNYHIEDLIEQIRDNIFIVPTNLNLAASERELVRAMRGEDRLKHVLRRSDFVKEVCDFVLIDCPPALNILTLNALTAAHGVVIPMESAFFPLVGVNLLLNTIEDVQFEVNPELKILGILPTRHAANTNHANETLNTVKEALSHIPLFEARIREAVKVKESPVDGKTISEYDPKHAVVQDYNQFVDELLQVTSHA